MKIFVRRMGLQPCQTRVYLWYGQSTAVVRADGVNPSAAKHRVVMMMIGYGVPSYDLESLLTCTPLLRQSRPVGILGRLEGCRDWGGTK